MEKTVQLGAGIGTFGPSAGGTPRSVFRRTTSRPTSGRDPGSRESTVDLSRLSRGTVHSPTGRVEGQGECRDPMGVVGVGEFRQSRRRTGFVVVTSP